MADFPSSDGLEMYCVMLYGTLGPVPPEPAHESQLSHPLIWSMFVYELVALVLVAVVEIVTYNCFL